MSRLDESFLRQVVIVTGFRGDAIRSCEAALLLVGLQNEPFTAAILPGERTQGSTTIAGCATGSLITQGLLEVCGRVKSPRPEANGRKVNLLRIPEGKASAVKTWLSRHGYAQLKESQQELFAEGAA